MVRQWHIAFAVLVFITLQTDVYARAPFGYVMSANDQMSPSWRPASRSFWSTLLGRDDAMQMRKRAYLRLGKRSGLDSDATYSDISLA